MCFASVIASRVHVAKQTNGVGWGWSNMCYLRIRLFRHIKSKHLGWMQNPTRSESTAASSTRDVLGTGQEINMITNLQKHIDGWVLKMMSELWLIETPLAKAVLKDSKESSFLQAGL